MSATYKRRWIRSDGVDEIGDWRLKRYTICHRNGRPRSDLRIAADGVLRRAVVTVEQAGGLGFWGLHEGPFGAYVFVDCWVFENELYHQLFTTHLDGTPTFEPVAPGRALACTWELRVIAHERDAWVRHALVGGGPSWADDYLRDQLDERA